MLTDPTAAPSSSRTATRYIRCPFFDPQLSCSWWARSDQVAEQDEDENRTEIRDVVVATVTHLFVRLIAQEIIDQFEGVLELSRVVRGEPRFQEGAEHDDNRQSAVPTTVALPAVSGADERRTVAGGWGAGVVCFLRSRLSPCRTVYSFW